MERKKYCPKCKSIMPGFDDEVYCGVCGSKLEEGPPDKVCGNCGKENYYFTKYCVYCGAKL